VLPPQLAVVCANVVPVQPEPDGAVVVTVPQAFGVCPLLVQAEFG